MAVRHWVKKGDMLAKYGAWHRRYQVVDTTHTKEGWVVSIKFVHNKYVDGTVEPAAQKGRHAKVREIMVGGVGADHAPIPPGYGLVEGKPDA